MKIEENTKIQVLLSVMNQTDYKLLENMKLKTDAIIINQCNTNNVKEILYNKRKVKIYSFKEKGVGLSRNTALDRASGEICLFADDDIVYEENYDQIIEKAFYENPKADVLVFNVDSGNSERPEYQIKKKKRLHKYTSLKYGSVRVAVRLKKVRLANIHFSLLFGGGATYSSGEDVLFLLDCLKKGLKVYSIPIKIGKIEQKNSTWFRGYDEKFFKDKGAYYKAVSKYLAVLLCLQFVIRKYKFFRKNMSRYDAFRIMRKGIKDYKKEWM